MAQENRQTPINTLKFKFLLIGPAESGKTNLLKRFVQNTFSDNYKKTIGTEFGVSDVIRQQEKIKLQIWDTDDFEACKYIQALYANSLVVFVVFDITKKESFDKVVNHLDNYIPLEWFPNITLVGNKVDLQNERQVTEEEVKKFIAKSPHKISGYIETSAKTSHNVQALFDGAVDQALKTLSSQNACPVRNRLIKDLMTYITRVSRHTNQKGQIDFSYGFWFGKNSRMINREANYYLAVSLLKNLRDTDDSIKNIFHQVIGQRNLIIQEKRMAERPDYKDRGINSTDLNKIINRAEEYITAENHDRVSFKV